MVPHGQGGRPPAAAGEACSAVKRGAGAPRRPRDESPGLTCRVISRPVDDTLVWSKLAEMPIARGQRAEPFLRGRGRGDAARLRPRVRGRGGGAGTCRWRFFAALPHHRLQRARLPPSRRARGPQGLLPESGRGRHRGMLDALGIQKAHICGLSMGATRRFTSDCVTPSARCPSWSRAPVTAAMPGAGALSGGRRGDGAALRAGRHEGGRRVLHKARRACSSSDKDPRAGRSSTTCSPPVGQGTRAHDAGRADDSARPCTKLEAEMERLTVPTLIVTGDEDEPCLEPRCS